MFGLVDTTLEYLPAGNNKFYCKNHTFNYLVEDGFAYYVVKDETVVWQLSINFLECIKENFKRRYGGEKVETAVTDGLKKEFDSKLKEHMQYCEDHPE